MNGKILGNLPETDPLYQYLLKEILPQFGIDHVEAQFAVQNSEASKNVYLYKENGSNVKLIGKYYPDNKNGELSKGEVEFRNLLHLRNLGFDSLPHYVVKPLGFNPAIGNVLLMEFLEGETLSKIIETGFTGAGKGDCIEN